MKISLTGNRLKELVSYCEETGIFVWKETRGKAIKGQSAGYLDKKTGYIQIGLDKTLYLAHRLAWLYVYGHFPSGAIDHKNRIGSDNRIANLRIANDSQNGANKPIARDNKSGFKGVSWHRGGRKWQASIKVNKKSIGLGLYENPEDAHKAYCAAAEKHFGEFARIS